MLVVTKSFAFTHNGLSSDVNADKVSVTLTKRTTAKGSLVIPEKVKDDEGNE